MQDLLNPKDLQNAYFLATIKFSSHFAAGAEPGPPHFGGLVPSNDPYH